MKKQIGLLAILTLGAATMYGQATRTWVSGVGDDANPCSRTAPCKTFAGAIAKTAPGGEIDALDPGGFGALTITKSITLDGGGGQVASVLVAGTNGIVVAAAATDVVIIRNMRLDGLLGGGNSNAGLDGIKFIGGKNLNVENCVIFGFNQNGIEAALNQNTLGSVHIVNTIIANVTQDGIKASNAQAPAVEVGIDHTQVTLTATSVEAAQHAHVRITNSFLEHGGSQGVLSDDAASSDSKVFIDHTDIQFNGSGGGVNSQTGGAVAVSFSNISNNAGPAFNAVGGTNFSYANTNRASNNTGGNGTFTSVPLLP